MSLDKRRKKIDRIDKKIIELLNDRAKETIRVRQIKHKLKQGIYTPHREKKIYENIGNYFNDNG